MLILEEDGPAQDCYFQGVFSLSIYPHFLEIVSVVLFVAVLQLLLPDLVDLLQPDAAAGLPENKVRLLVGVVVTVEGYFRA